MGRGLGVMRWLAVVLSVFFLFLQYQLWFAKGGVAQSIKQHNLLVHQGDSLSQLKDRNKKLAANVHDLKSGHQMVESHARQDLGMIKKGEVFYQTVNSKRHQ
jgi:cell division protein FtsB